MIAEADPLSAFEMKSTGHLFQLEAFQISILIRNTFLNVIDILFVFWILKLILKPYNCCEVVLFLRYTSEMLAGVRGMDFMGSSVEELSGDSVLKYLRGSRSFSQNEINAHDIKW